MEPLKKARYVWNHPANKSHQFRALARSSIWQIRKRLFGGYQDVRITDSRVIRCYSHIDNTPLIIYAGLYDFCEMNFLLRYLRGDDNFLDVGGNVGVYSILASSVIGGGEIHVFEPSAEAREILEENIRINRLENIAVYPCAVGEISGTVKFTKSEESMNHIVVGGAPEDFNEVALVRLEDEVADVEFAMGKIDVEGFELQALKGAAGMLEAQNPPVWIVELGEASERYGYKNEELLDYMRKFGYRTVCFDVFENSAKWDDDIWRNSLNAIVVAESKKGEVDKRLAV